jgi:nitroreductase
MDVYEAIRVRKSVREFEGKDIPEETLMRLLGAARLAPSASNRQEWRFVVVRDPETRRKLTIAARNQSFVGEAPVVLACCAETDEHKMSCGQFCYPIDVAIAMDHLTLSIPLPCAGARTYRVLGCRASRGPTARCQSPLGPPPGALRPN